jgi:hypothetical protein
LYLFILAGQWLGKNANAAANIKATTEEFLEA